MLRQGEVINSFCSLCRHVVHVLRLPVYLVNKLGSDHRNCLARRDLDHLWLGDWLGTILCAGSLAW